MTLHFQILQFQEFSLMKFSKFALSTLSAATLGFLALGVASTSAFAATNATTSFNVTANVGNTCTITHTDLAFGTVTNAGNNDATSNISVTCSSGDVYTVGLGPGSSGSDTARTMKGLVATGDVLGYSLTSGSATGPNWGLTVGAQGTTGTGTAQSYTVYGRVTGAQVTTAAAQIGGNQNYSDAITITLTY
jgi:spore coat protein U-like protein